VIGTSWRASSTAYASRVLDERPERHAKPVLLGLAQRQQRLAAALDEERSLATEQHYCGAGDAGRAARGPFRPGQPGAVGLCRIRRREHERLRLFPFSRAQLAQALDRAPERELGAAETLDEVAAAADPERLELAELSVHGRIAARDALGAHAVAGDDALALEQELCKGTRIGPVAREEPLGRRPAALRGRDRVRPGAREAARALLRPGRLEPATRPQRLPRVVRHLAGPDEIPEGRESDHAVEAGRAEQVEPEERPTRERCADSLVRLAFGRRKGAPAAERRRILAEVHGHPLEARADPDDLAGGGELVEPGGLVAGDAARQHIALPERDRQ